MGNEESILLFFQALSPVQVPDAVEGLESSDDVDSDVSDERNRVASASTNPSWNES